MESAKATLLVVDDIADTVEVLERNLTAAGFSVLTASGVHQAAEILDHQGVDVVITDLKMPGASGLELIRHVQGNFPDTATLMITGYPSVEGAVQAVKSGAEDFLPKPFTDEELLRAVHHALDKLQARRAIAGAAKKGEMVQGIVGECTYMRRLAGAMQKAAGASSPVLIVGETGVGKETIARAIHYGGAKGSGAFVLVDLAGIPHDQIVSEVIGRPDSAAKSAGLLGAAGSGTLYVEAVDLAPAGLQDALAARLDKLKCRLMVSASRALLPLAKRGQYRSDLAFSLSALTLEIPPLRQRGDDVLLLTHHFADRLARQLGKKIPSFSDKAIEVLRSYSWPGNVHELKAVVAHLVTAAGEQGVEVTDLPALMRFSVLREGSALRTLDEVEAEHIQRVIEVTGGNRSHAAQILGIDRKTLRDKMKRNPGRHE